MNLEGYLEQDARLYPQKTAVVCRGKETSYATLWASTLQRRDELGANGVSAGRIHLFRASQDEDFLLTYFATHIIGAIAAPLERDMPETKFRELQSWTSGYNLTNGAADVLFTTGTTGQSKGVMISHETIVAEAENLAEAQGFSHDTVFVISGPLNHIGSLSKVFPVILLGGTLYITEGMKDMNAFFQALDYPSSRLATFLVPASIRMLLQLGDSRLSAYADKIDFIETGAAAIAQSDMEALCAVLPRTRLFNTYASTETGIISTFNYNEGYCKAGCLGKPMKHSTLFITEEGHVACQGKTLMLGYLGDEGLTRTVLRDDTVYTSDCGHLDEQGRLHLSGRHGDVINVGGFKVNPIEVEDAALSSPMVKDCICIPMRHKILGTVLKLLVVTSNDADFNKRELAHYIKERLERYKVPQLYEQVESIRRTYNGKLDRKFYANEV